MLTLIEFSAKVLGLAEMPAWRVYAKEETVYIRGSSLLVTPPPPIGGR